MDNFIQRGRALQDATNNFYFSQTKKFSECGQFFSEIKIVKLSLWVIITLFVMCLSGTPTQSHFYKFYARKWDSFLMWDSSFIWKVVDSRKSRFLWICGSRTFLLFFFGFCSKVTGFCDLVVILSMIRLSPYESIS